MTSVNHNSTPRSQVVLPVLRKGNKFLTHGEEKRKQRKRKEYSQFNINSGFIKRAQTEEVKETHTHTHVRFEPKLPPQRRRIFFPRRGGISRSNRNRSSRLNFNGNSCPVPRTKDSSQYHIFFRYRCYLSHSLRSAQAGMAHDWIKSEGSLTTSGNSRESLS